MAKQRRDYSLDTEAFPVQYPVEKQAARIDYTPVNNLDMERLMGKTDYRLQKGRKGIIPGKTTELSETNMSSISFRSYRKEVEAKRDKELKWNKKQRERFVQDADALRTVAISKERKRMDLMEKLKDIFKKN